MLYIQTIQTIQCNIGDILLICMILEKIKTELRVLEPFMTCYEHEHRLENRCVLRLISNMNFLSLVVLGRRGCREKKIQPAISMQLLGQFR